MAIITVVWGCLAHVRTAGGTCEYFSTNSVRAECDCRWCSAPDGNETWQAAMWAHLGTFSDAIACPKVNFRAGDPQDKFGFMGRKPACSFSDCTLCGFGKQRGMPTSKALETSEQLVK